MVLNKRQYIITLTIGLFILLLLGLNFFLKPDANLSENDKTNAPVKSISLSDNTTLQLIASTSADYLAIKESINQINKKIDKLDVSIAKLNQNIEAVSIQREEKLKEAVVGFPKNLPNPPPAMGLQNERQQPMENPTAWLSDLDKDTRTRIDNVFKQNALRMRETIKNMGVSPENMDREAMQEMIESNQESLKNELKKVLSPEDYEKFLKSLPAPPDLTVPKK